MKSGNLNFLEPSGPLQACNGTDLSSYNGGDWDYVAGIVQRLRAERLAFRYPAGQDAPDGLCSVGVGCSALEIKLAGRELDHTSLCIDQDKNGRTHIYTSLCTSTAREQGKFALFLVPLKKMPRIRIMFIPPRQT